MGDRQNSARTLIEKVWGSNFFDSIPAKWKSATRILREKVPGVRNGTDPDTPTDVTADNLTDEVVATSQVTTNRINELEKVTEKVQASLLLESTTHGQELVQPFGIPIPYTEHLSLDNAEVGDANKEVNPLNPILSEVKEYDNTALAAFLDTYVMSYTGKVNIEFPDVLSSVTGFIETVFGEGTFSETGDAELFGSGSVSLSLRATAQSSASIIPDAFPGILQFWGNNIDATHYHFFLPSPVTASDVLSKLEDLIGVAVSSWPKFNPQIHTIQMYGQRLSLQVTASSQGSASFSESGSSSSAGGGTGYSKETGLTVKTLRISPTIHGSVSVGGTTSSTQDISADATAEASGVGPSETITESGTVSSGMSPSTLAATTGATTWPTSGKFLYRTDPEPFRNNYVQFHCVVVDATDFPNVP